MPWSTASRSRRINVSRPVWRVLLDRFRDLAFQRCFASVLVESVTAGGLTLYAAHHSLFTTHFRKIKNPASSAGYNHSHLSGSTRCSTVFYPVLVKNLTLGSTSWPSLDSTLGRRFFDPTVMPLAPRGPSNFLQLPLERSATPEPFVSIRAFPVSSSPRNNYFCRFPQPCGRSAKGIIRPARDQDGLEHNSGHASRRKHQSKWYDGPSKV